MINRILLSIVSLALYTISVNGQVSGGKDSTRIKREALNKIQGMLGQSVFVHRFESIEVPCVYLSADDDKTASPNTISNSNFLIRSWDKNNPIDSSGVICLSKYYSRYLKLEVDTGNTDVEHLTIQGKVKVTYSYPLSSIIQYLDFAKSGQSSNNGRTSAFLERFLYTDGTFRLYPENEKYRIEVSLPEPPYGGNYKFIGYLENSDRVTISATDTLIQRGLRIYFDRMYVVGGDQNNQIFLEFGSTDHREETQYFCGVIYHHLKHNDKYAVWLRNYLSNPSCPGCLSMLRCAESILQSNQHAPKTLPNLDPIPQK